MDKEYNTVYKVKGWKNMFNSCNDCQDKYFNYGFGYNKQNTNCGCNEKHEQKNPWNCKTVKICSYENECIGKYSY